MRLKQYKGVIFSLAGGGLLLALAALCLAYFRRHGEILMQNPDGGGWTPVNGTAVLFMAVLSVAFLWRGISRWLEIRSNLRHGIPSFNKPAECDRGAKRQSSAEHFPPAAPQHKR